MHCFAFHLMPWDRLPADFGTKYESAWTWLPNSLYDPPHGNELYNRYLDELVLADELGFDGVCVHEHHQNAYGTMPSPNLIGAILARQTKRVRPARRYGYMGIPYFHIDFFQRNFDLFRECASKCGYEASPYQLGWLCPIYVAETDERAWAEYEQHLFYFAKNLLKGLAVIP